MKRSCKYFVLATGLIAASSAHASISSTTCQVVDATGQEVTEPVSFSARARFVRTIRVTHDGIVRLRWPFYKSGLTVIMEKNPYYPFNVPFTTEELGRATIDKNADGFIQGTLDLSPIKEGYLLQCQESKD